MKPVFNSVMYENIKISQAAFYHLGGFSNPDLFRTDEGHFQRVETAAYKAFKIAKAAREKSK